MDCSLDYLGWVPNRGACIDACLSGDVTRSFRLHETLSSSAVFEYCIVVTSATCWLPVQTTDVEAEGKLEAEAVEAVKFLWKRSTLKKKAGSGSELGSI